MTADLEAYYQLSLADSSSLVIDEDEADKEFVLRRALQTIRDVGDIDAGDDDVDLVDDDDDDVSIEDCFSTTTRRPSTTKFARMTSTTIGSPDTSSTISSVDGLSAGGAVSTPMRCKKGVKASSTTPSGGGAGRQVTATGARRNERERNRVKQVNLGFDRLRQHVPQGRKNKKLSKVDTLKAAVYYIQGLQQLLRDTDAVFQLQQQQQQQQSGEGDDDGCGGVGIGGSVGGDDDSNGDGGMTFIDDVENIPSSTTSSTFPLPPQFGGGDDDDEAKLNAWLEICKAVAAAGHLTGSSGCDVNGNNLYSCGGDGGYGFGRTSMTELLMAMDRPPSCLGSVDSGVASPATSGCCTTSSNGVSSSLFESLLPGGVVCSSSVDAEQQLLQQLLLEQQLSTGQQHLQPQQLLQLSDINNIPDDILNLVYSVR